MTFLNRRLFDNVSVFVDSLSGANRVAFDVNKPNGILTLAISGNIVGDNVKVGTGSPEGSVVGKVGDVYQRKDGGTNTTLYIKESGSGNTGWTALGAPVSGGGSLSGGIQGRAAIWGTSSSISASHIISEGTDDVTIRGTTIVTTAKADGSIWNSIIIRDGMLGNVNDSGDHPGSRILYESSEAAANPYRASIEFGSEQLGMDSKSRLSISTQNAYFDPLVPGLVIVGGNIADDGHVYIKSAEAIPNNAGETVQISGSLLASSTIASSNIKRGTGSPEGVITGVVGDVYQRTNGAAGTTLYIKESGSGNTGWTAVAPGSSGGSSLSGGTAGRVAIWSGTSNVSASPAFIEQSDRISVYNKALEVYDANLGVLVKSTTASLGFSIRDRESLPGVQCLYEAQQYNANGPVINITMVGSTSASPSTPQFSCWPAEFGGTQTAYNATITNRTVWQNNRIVRYTGTLSNGGWTWASGTPTESRVMTLETSSASGGIPKLTVLGDGSFTNALTVGSTANNGIDKLQVTGSAGISGWMVSSNIKRGVGTPEGFVTGNVGDIFQRTDGSVNNVLYYKESGSGNTGWMNVNSTTGLITAGSIGASGTLAIYNRNFSFVDYYVKNANTPPNALAGTYTLGIQFMPTRNVSVLGVRAFTAQSTGSITAKLWKSGTSTALTSATSTFSASGHYNIYFPTPYIMSEADIMYKFYATILTSGNLYTRTSALNSRPGADPAVIYQQEPGLIYEANPMSWWRTGDDIPNASSGLERYPVEPIFDMTLAAFSGLTTGSSGVSVSLPSSQVAFGSVSNQISGSNSMTFSLTGGFTVNRSGALRSTTIGLSAGNNTMTGADNTYFGWRAGESTTTATRNTAFGVSALAAITDVSDNDNTAFGHRALAACSQQQNTAVGAFAAEVCATGSQNTAVGYNALSSNTGASNNTAIGRGSLAQTTGTSNTAVGNDAGSGITGGTGNSVMGNLAGQSIGSGTNNISIGSSSNIGSSLANNVVIGSGATVLGVGSNGSIAIGTDADVDSGSVIGLGREVTIPSSNSNTFVAGSPNYPINTVYFGKGISSTTPSAYAIAGTRGTGSNIGGGSLQFVAGLGTGNASSGLITFRTAGPGTAGSSLNNTIDRFTIHPDGRTYWHGISSALSGGISGTGAMYFNSSENKFKVIEGTGSWVDLVSSGSSSLSGGVAGRLAIWSGTSSISASSIITENPQNERVRITGSVVISGGSYQNDFPLELHREWDPTIHSGLNGPTLLISTPSGPHRIEIGASNTGGWSGGLINVVEDGVTNQSVLRLQPSDGRVVIGEMGDNTSNQLQVKGSAIFNAFMGRVAIDTYNGSGMVHMFDSDGFLRLRIEGQLPEIASGHSALCVNVTGNNVLIGTSTDDATHKLQVEGSVKVNSLNVNGGALYNYAATVVVESGTSLTIDPALHTGRIINFTAGTTVTVSVPNSTPEGFNCLVVQSGAGPVTFSGVTNRQSHTFLAGQYATASLVCTENPGGSSAVVIFSGDTST